VIINCRRGLVRTPERKFGDFLKSRGLKFTPQRRSILRSVFSIHEHFDVESLYQRLRKTGEKISLATLYRMIPLLVESGMIKEALRREGNVTYEHVYGHKHHDHLVCVVCGRAIEFFDEELERRKGEVCERYGFEPAEHRLTITGVCSECRGK
jgi:Fur family ferric uptake transcriptional regulator